MIHETMKLADILAETAVQDRNNKMHRGSVLIETLIAEAAQMANSHRKGSEVTLKLVFEPGADNQLDIRVEMANKLPKHKSTPVLAYLTAQGQLVTDDPAQQKLLEPKEFRSNV